MTKQLLNTLFLMTQGSVARLDNDTVRIEHEGEKLLQVPLHHLGSICAFGHVVISHPLMMKCAEEGRTIALFDMAGRFKARVQGKTTGNVLLRKAQYDFIVGEHTALRFAVSIVAGKLQNSRQVLLRAARDAANKPCELAAEAIELLLPTLADCQTIDEVRGIEGIAAQIYFEAFDGMIKAQRTHFRFDTRSRRPPRDRMNALLSFLYSIATNDCVSALEGVGLDPQMGILHALRPGRPSLALDLIEEFRSIILDRFALTLVNRKQVTEKHFEERVGGSVMLNEPGRKIVLAELQRRKQVEIAHPFLVEKVPVGLLPHIQARLMARTFRGELTHYRPFLPKG
jgi:CRISPR-associated protein Cas1